MLHFLLLLPNGILLSSVCILTVSVLVMGAGASSSLTQVTAVVRCGEGVVVFRSGGSAVEKEDVNY